MKSPIMLLALFTSQSHVGMIRLQRVKLHWNDMDTKQLIVTRQFFLPDGFQGIVDIFADNLKSVTKAFH